MTTLELFDANGSFGTGARSRPDRARPADLLAHMDRLGIARALTWHVAARDLNPTWGNRRLLAEIDAAGASERLIPAYTIAPSMLYEQGAMEDLVSAMASGRVRALRAFPGTLRHTLCQLEPVIEKVAIFHPILLVDSKDALQPDDLLALAARLPHTPMIFMQGMWGDVVTMLDLMRRRPNILIDISWLHTPETIDLVIRNFGAQRMVFATGPQAHNGASIAALAYAGISDQDRSLIAHGNLERLLTQPGTAALPGPHGDQSLWGKFLREEDLDVEIIDAHTHLGSSGMAVLPRGQIEGQIAYALERMDRLHIRSMIVSGMQALLSDPVEGNLALEKSCRPYGDRFLGYLGCNPFYNREMIPRFDEFFSGTFFVGLKLLCDYWGVPLTDPRFIPVWEYANQHCLPVLLHTWEGRFDSPALLKEIAPAYPDAMILLGHSGGGNAGRREAEELAVANPNVYLEFCGSFTSNILWEETIGRVGADRVLFGTDSTFHDPAWELGRLLSLDLPAETIRPILGGNMRRLLGRRR